MQSTGSPPFKRNTKNLSLKLNSHQNESSQNNCLFSTTPTTSTNPFSHRDTNPTSPSSARLYRHPSFSQKATDSQTTSPSNNSFSEKGLRRRTTLSLSIPLESDALKNSSMTSSSSSKLSSSSVPSFNFSSSPTISSPSSLVQPSSNTSPKLTYRLNRSDSSHSSNTTIKGSFPDSGDMKTQTLIHNLSNIDISDDGDNSKLNVYPDGPKCVYEPYLYLYSEPTLNQIEEYDIVINVAEELTPPFLSKSELNELSDETSDVLHLTHVVKSQDKIVNYYYVPWTHTSKITKNLPKLTDIIIESLSKGQKVLIHCQCGVSRSASLIVAFFMKLRHLNLNDSYNILKTQAPDISPNMSLIFQLMEWGESIGVDNVVTTPQYELEMNRMNNILQ